MFHKNLQLLPKYAYCNPSSLPINNILADVESIIQKQTEVTKNESSRFLKSNPDLYVLNADKCSVTVLITKSSRIK